VVGAAVDEVAPDVVTGGVVEVGPGAVVTPIVVAVVSGDAVDAT
jgi:hypothetical protein